MDISRERRRIVRETVSFFNGRGFPTVDPEPLIPRRDDSILFTNSAVVSFKPYLRRELQADPGVVVAQDCLRWQNLGDLSGRSVRRHLISHFVMLGVFSRRDRAKEFAREIIALLDVLKVDPSRLALKLRSCDASLAEPWRSAPCPYALVFDSEPDPYYDWSFGMEGVRGVGGTFSFSSPDGGDRDFGNIIEFYAGSELLGLGYGFGIEAFMNGLHRLPNVACALPSSARTDTRDPRVGRLADLLETATLLYRAGLRPGRSGHAYVVKRVVRGIGRLAPELGFSDEALYRLVQEFERGETGSVTNTAARLLADCRRHARRRRKPGGDLVRRDISLVGPRSLDPSVVADFVRREFRWRLASVDVFDVYEGPAIPPDRRSVGLALRLPREDGRILVPEIVRCLCSAFPVAPRGPGAGRPA